MRIIVLFTLCFSWSYAKRSETLYKGKTKLKKLPTIRLHEQAGSSVTLECPIRPSVQRMYRYLSRIKTGKQLERAKLQMVPLLGVRYRWYKDGKPIRHHRSAWSMKLQDLKLEDAGEYTCKVTMPRRTRSRNFVLRITTPLGSGRPILESESRNISVRVGQSTDIRCVSGNTRHRPKITWLKWRKGQTPEITKNFIKTLSLTQPGKDYEIINRKQSGKAVSSTVRANVRHGQKNKSYEFILTLENAKIEDSGLYLCLVKNKYGSDWRKLNVQVSSMKGVAPYPTNQKQRRRYMVYPTFSPARLNCYVTGDQPLTYQWFKNGKKFTHRKLGGKVNSTTSVLRMRNLLPSDSGRYTCRASNPYGEYSHNIKLEVVTRILSAPILLKTHPKNITSTPGKNVTFECIELLSNPMPDYRWYKWHTVPDTYPRLNFDNTSQFTEIDPIHYTPMQVNVHNTNRYAGKLTLKNITEDDFGLYSCVLRNQFGMDYSSAFLHRKPNEGPKFVSSKARPTVIKIPQTAPLKLNCDATGDPKPSIMWFRNGELLSPTQNLVLSSYTLTLRKILPRHSGNYTCHVKNTWGNISHTFEVQIKELLFTRPIILPSRKKVLHSGERYELKCTIVSREPLAPSLTMDLDTKLGAQESLKGKAKLVKLDKRVYQFSYVIRNATRKDSGNYTCVARNSIGKSQRKFQIHVEA
ncbi:hemicentin-1-like isoform X2 [Dendronephthya gigantea]|nr:hemicentin-1-like isoform X2 [Dendronephthya gigantea]XP_028414945.1 hemicentin-1-like isoform X2 [Dendronephthya gigantea]